MRQENWNQLYNQWNEQYFGGALDANAVILAPEIHISNGNRRTVANYYPITRKIHLIVPTKPNLLHEMVHAWQAVLRRPAVHDTWFWETLWQKSHQVGVKVETDEWLKLGTAKLILLRHHKSHLWRLRHVFAF